MHVFDPEVFQTELTLEVDGNSFNNWACSDFVEQADQPECSLPFKLNPKIFPDPLNEISRGYLEGDFGNLSRRVVFL